jgi:hypothetical protein
MFVNSIQELEMCCLSELLESRDYYEIDKERRLVTSTASGVLTLGEVWAHQKKLLQDPDFHPSFSQLMDLTQITKLELSSEDVRRVAGNGIFSPNSRQAILASSNLVYGLARMFQILREMKGEEGIRVFRDRDEALAWVLGKDSAD